MNVMVLYRSVMMTFKSIVSLSPSLGPMDSNILKCVYKWTICFILNNK